MGHQFTGEIKRRLDLSIVHSLRACNSCFSHQGIWWGVGLFISVGQYSQENVLHLLYRQSHMPDFSFCQRGKIFPPDSEKIIWERDYCLHARLHAQVPKLSFPPRAHLMTPSLLWLWRIQNGHDITIEMMSLWSPVSTQCCNCCSLNSHCHAHKWNRKYTYKEGQTNQLCSICTNLINCAVCVLNG